MTRTTVTSNAELAAWLTANTAFADAETVLLIVGSKTLRLVLALPIAGSYRAGTMRTMRDYALTATGVQGLEEKAADAFRAGHCCLGLELLDVEAGVGFSVDLPGALGVRCASLAIEPLASRFERVKPWLSDREISARVRGMELPSPEDWVRRFRERGVDVCWRILGDRAAGTPTDGAGWFLQEPALLGESHGGLFFFACAVREGALILQWQRWHRVSDALWRAAREVLGDLPPGEIGCGNCELTVAEWRVYVATGALPERLA